MHDSTQNTLCRGPQEPTELIGNVSKKVSFKGLLLGDDGHGVVGSVFLELMDCKNIPTFVKIAGFIVKKFYCTPTCTENASALLVTHNSNKNALCRICNSLWSTGTN